MLLHFSPHQFRFALWQAELAFTHSLEVAFSPAHFK
jgi:hypothetical protein